ncbi:hypothetical protein AMECASPLE_002146 [Ameca splendens]|uniref:Uncharacterized protein n=1 Tax=Ameca splendens TaxID=208324 RepID=A0ABV0XA52_9TELE
MPGQYSAGCLYLSENESQGANYFHSGTHGVFGACRPKTACTVNSAPAFFLPIFCQSCQMSQHIDGILQTSTVSLSLNRTLKYVRLQSKHVRSHFHCAHAAQ